MDGVQIANIAIGAAGLSICSLGLAQTIVSRSMERRTRQYFIAFFFLLVVYVAADLLSNFVNGSVNRMIMLFLESAFSSFLAPLLTCFLLERSGADRRRSGAFRAAAALELAYMTLLIYTQFSQSIYYYDAHAVYHRGPYYPLLLVPPIGIMLINLCLLWNVRNRLSKRERLAFAVYILAPTICMVFQLLFFGLYVIVLGSSIGAMVMFLNIQSDQTERYAKKESENERLRTEIMLSQIQPHFINNTLGAIGYLCRDNPEAKAAVNKFTRYLQGNMDSLTQTGPIPFTTELEHTKAYLELEQLRFREKLNIVYDLEATEFLLPTLTLQPLVENAVFHGVRGNANGRGTVTVSSREYADRYEVTVADDGPGFDPAEPPTDDGGSHIGLQNVRSRLRSVGGTLRLDAAPGQGCRVTIELPKEARSC
ncbi:MAG: sensor histidine kinase [Ruminococcaceae bacterium]|nr:sensor histidine kinase [Oscillospiraceae bacterium]